MQHRSSRHELKKKLVNVTPVPWIITVVTRGQRRKASRRLYQAEHSDFSSRRNELFGWLSNAREYSNTAPRSLESRPRRAIIRHFSLYFRGTRYFRIASLIRSITPATRTEIGLLIPLHWRIFISANPLQRFSPRRLQPASIPVDQRTTAAFSYYNLVCQYYPPVCSSFN